jgi:preprotein translocase subunit YajC
MTHGFSLFLAALQFGGKLGTLGPFLFQMGLIALIVYFLILRPPQQQRKAHEERVRNLKKGDSIVTAGGLVGEVVFIKETMKDGAPMRSLDDLVTIKSGESKVVVERGRIAKILGDTGTEAPTKS